MKYFIHSDDCVYDSATGTWTVTMDRQISNPVMVTLQQVLYEAPINGDGYPAGVYLESKALTRMNDHKHAVQLKAENHEDSTDIVALLQGSPDTPNHFGLRYPVRFRVVPSRIERALDFRFHNNGTLLVAGSGTSSTTTVDHTEVIDDFSAPSGQTRTGFIFHAFDDGGSGANYADNTSLDRVYTTSSGNNIKLEILGFVSEANYDKLTIQEIDANGGVTDLLTQYSGLAPPSQTVYTSSTDTLKLLWTADGSNNNVGFDIIIWDDDNGNNTLTNTGTDPSTGMDVYKLTTSSTTTTSTTATGGNKFVAELEIQPSH